MQRIQIPDKVESIGANAFQKCTSLQELVLGKGVEKIGGNAFSNCTKLSRIEIEGNVEEIGSLAFYDTAVKELGIGEGVSELKQTFYALSTLEKIEVEEGNKAYAGEEGILYNKEKTELICYPQKKADITEYKVPEGVESIREYAFYRNTDIVKIILPESLENIGKYAFGYCSNLTDVSITEGLKNIGEYAFAYCSSMKVLQLPDSLENIGMSVFSSCQDLTIYCNANSKIAAYAEKYNISYITATYRITCNLKKYCSVLNEDQKAIEMDSIQNYQVKIYNKTTERELENYHINNETIVLNTRTVDVNDELTITISSKKGEITECSTDIVLDEKCSAETDILLQQRGYVITTPQTSMETTILIYDSSGQLCDSMMSEGDARISKYLEKGNYYILYIQGNISMWKYQNIDTFKQNIMLEEGKDYLIKEVTVLDGKITDTGTVVIPDINIEQLRYLDSAKCSFYTNVNEISAGGLITVRISYEFKENRKNEVSVEYIEIAIPKGCKYVSDSLQIDGKIADNVKESTETLKIPIRQTKGIISYNIKPVIYGSISTSAQIRFKTAEKRIIEQIGTVEVSAPYITINVPSTTSQKTIVVSGLTVPNISVGIYDGNHRIGTAVSSKSGKWSKSIQLYGAVEDSVHNIQAKIYIGTTNEQKSEVVSVGYSPKAVSIEQFTMYYNNHSFSKIDLTDITYKAKPIISFYPAYPFTFVVKLSNNEDVDNVYVVSTKNGNRKTMKASYDDKSGTWIASGYFDNKNHYYVPGVLSVEFNGKKFDYVVEFGQENEEIPEELPEKIKNGSCNITENSYDKQTDTGSYGGVYTLADEDKTEVEFHVSKELVEPGNYNVDTLKKSGYLKVETDDESSTYYTKTFCDDNDGFVTETIQFRKYYYEDPKLGKTFKEIAYSKLVTKVKSIFIKEAEGALPGIGLASKIWDVSKSVISIGGRIYNLDHMKNELWRLRSKLSEEEYKKRENAIKALETSYWMYLVGKSIIKGAQIYTSIQFPIVGPIANLGFGFLTSYFYAYLDDWYDEQLKMILNCDIRWAIDPSGYVYEAVESNRLEGVKATIYYQGEDGNEIEWEANEYEQNNPLITDSEGEYSWDVPEGLWRVKFEKEGYQTVYSEWLPVPPVQTEININMISTENPQVSMCELYEKYALISFNKYMQTNTVNAEHIIIKAESGAIIKGKIEPVNVDESTGISLAKEFRIVFDEPLKNGAYEIDISRAVKNYANLELTENYNKMMTVQQSIEDITVDIPKNIVMNREDIEIPVKIVTSGKQENYEIVCSSSETDLVEITEIEKPDNDGNARIHIKTKLPGVVALKIGVKGHSICKEIELEVQQFEVEPEYTKGDVNEDEVVDIQDLRMILRYVCGKQDLNDVQIIAADVNEDGTVDIQDLRKILRFVCGKEETL